MQRNDNRINYIFLSGLNLTGKTILTDFFREFKGVYVPSHTSEFDLIRIQGGLLDLSNAIHEDWSPIRSDAAIRRFQRVIARVGTVASLSNPSSLFYANGMSYDSTFNHKFLEISEKYINSLIEYRYSHEWPYLSIDKLPILQFWQRLRRVIFKKKIFPVEIFGTDPTKFLDKTKFYLDELFQTIVADEDHFAVIHNAIEPFNPTRGLDLFSNGRLIVVQRDPRDVYASSFPINNGYKPTFEEGRLLKLKMGLTSAYDIEKFILRQRIQYESIQTRNDDHRVLRLKFEDIILKYEESIKQIIQFLNLDKSQHIYKRQFFNPNLSKKNIGLWKSHGDYESIRRIERELGKYCYTTEYD